MGCCLLRVEGAKEVCAVSGFDEGRGVRMSNWPFLEQARVTKPDHTVPSQYVSDASYGFNGLFRFALNGKLIRCVVSDGGGWQHVSVSIEYERNHRHGVLCAR